MTTTERLHALRKLMQQHDLDYYYIPARDQHNNEYVPERWQRRAWISHFTGSAGDALIGKDQAYLWTDARYFLQAETELDANLFQLMKQQQGMSPNINEWLLNHAAGKTVGVDPRLIGITQAKRWQAALATNGGKLVMVDENLIDQIWENQPALCDQPIRLYPQQYAGADTAQKLEQVRAKLKAQHCTAHVVTMLDAIAWLYNIRGNDVDFNPLVISYALVTMEQAFLFVDPQKITEEDREYFTKQQITVMSYTDTAQQLARLSGPVLCDHLSSMWVAQQLRDAELVLADSPITLLKAVKNSTEAAGMMEAHRQDAIAMVNFLHWLDENWQGQTELSCAEKLREFRMQNDQCLDLSFNTISAFADHGAIVHYAVDEKSNRKIDDSALFLIDSGGQYWEGTTDITRTIHLGEPSAQEKQHFTLVLKGQLALRHAVFPHGSTGANIDAFAHQYLWQAGLDFAHGTGHGVGCYLCVHEGPQRISQAMVNVPLLPGMIVSNEPGVYFDGQYGIRIENLCVITECIAKENSKTGNGPFYTLNDLTIVPYAKKLIDKSMLNSDEKNWVDEYHQSIYETLAPSLNKMVRDWLKKATLPL